MIAKLIAASNPAILLIVQGFCQGRSLRPRAGARRAAIYRRVSAFKQPPCPQHLQYRATRAESASSAAPHSGSGAPFACIIGSCEEAFGSRQSNTQRVWRVKEVSGQLVYNSCLAVQGRAAAARMALTCSARLCRPESDQMRAATSSGRHPEMKP